jgi:hypothetical protein
LCIPLLDRQGAHAADRHVLADFGDQVCQRLLDRSHAARIGARLQRIEVIAGIEDKPGDVSNKRLKGVVAGNEVGFRIDLHNRTPPTVECDPDQAFGRDAPGFLRRQREPFRAQPVLGVL